MFSIPYKAENPRAHHSKASKGVEKSYSEIGDYLYSRSGMLKSYTTEKADFISYSLH